MTTAFGSPTPSCALRFVDWTGGRDLRTIGTNAGSEPIPFQRWRVFKEAFAPELIAYAVAEMKRPVRHIIDPFGGSGTTGLAAQFLGIRPTLIEVNPYLADLIESKLGFYDLNQVRDRYAWLIDRVSSTQKVAPPFIPGAAKTFVEPGQNGRFIFSKETARRIATYKRSIDEIDDSQIRRLFRVILGSIVVSVSNVVVSGKGRRYRRGWKERTVETGRVDRLFRQSAEDVIYDLRRYQSRLCREYTVLRGDARALLGSIEDADLAVFSPPYPNSFDYTDVYNVELWALGYLTDRDTNLRLRRATLRSHVQIQRDMSGTKYPSKTLTRTLDHLRKSSAQLWNKNIPAMIEAYVSDMGDIMAMLHRKLCRSGRIYMVVGDSCYANVNIPVAQILCEVGPLTGWRVGKVEPFRSMRVSPQQGGQHGLAESLMVLQRP